MTTKSSNLYVRIEPEVKEKAESILAALGISVSGAINMFYKQIILQKGIPFDVKIPSTTLVDITKLSDSDLDEELDKGYQDMKCGRTTKLKNNVHLILIKGNHSYPLAAFYFGLKVIKEIKLALNT